MESCASEVLWRNSWVLSWTKIWPRRFSHGAMSAMFMFILPRSLTARLWKKMVGKRISFWEGLFSGASCSTSGVYQTFFRNIFSIHPKSRLFRVFLIIRNDKKRSLKKVFQSPPKMISPGINQNINKPHTHTQITIITVIITVFLLDQQLAGAEKSSFWRSCFFPWPKNNGENHDFATLPDAFADWCLKWSHGLYGSFLASTEKQNPETEQRLKKTVAKWLKRFQRIVETFLYAWRICFFFWGLINSCLLTVFLLMKKMVNFRCLGCLFFGRFLKGRGDTETLFLFGFHAKG